MRPRNLTHALWRLLPPSARRAAIAHATAWLSPRPDHTPPPTAHGLTVAGELARTSGIGESARLMAAATERLGTEVWRADIPPPVDPTHELPKPTDPMPPPGVPLAIHINAPQLPLAFLRAPRALSKGRRIIGCWYWELPTPPPDWRPGARFVHDIWAPSRFTADALEPLKPGRVRVVPPPLADAPPIPAHVDRTAFGLPANAVITLVSFNLASSFARKNPLAAIAAFREAFGDRPDRILLLKIGHPDHAPADFERIRQAAKAPNIRIETRSLPTADSHALTACCDIVLSLHRSEGFGLVPAEAMFLGKPVIATAWSGNMDFMDAETAALVGYRLIPVHDDRMVYRNSVWADPDIREAAGHLRRLADDAQARQALGARGQAHVRRVLTSAPLAAAMRDIGLHVPA
jgi:glycosyltransferase involved in cell wall biosynthesis